MSFAFLTPTPETWLPTVLADFDRFLLDHASCERKAAASAMALVSRYGELPPLVETMVTLAREELEHFAQVHRLLVRRHLRLGADDKDPYVNALLTAVRATPAERLLDRLLLSALIEARSCERFALLAAAPTAALTPELRRFYTMLQRSEAGHYQVFHRLAERLYGEGAVAARWPVLCAHEAAVMAATAVRAAVH